MANMYSENIPDTVSFLKQEKHINKAYFQLIFISKKKYAHCYVDIYFNLVRQMPMYFILSAVK